MEAGNNNNEEMEEFLRRLDANRKRPQSRAEALLIKARRLVIPDKVEDIFRRSQYMRVQLDELYRVGNQDPKYAPVLQEMDAMTSAIDVAQSVGQIVATLVPNGKGLMAAGMVVGVVGLSLLRKLPRVGIKR